LVHESLRKRTTLAKALGTALSAQMVFRALHTNINVTATVTRAATV